MAKGYMQKHIRLGWQRSLDSILIRLAQGQRFSARKKGRQVTLAFLVAMSISQATCMLMAQ